ncbi:MAG TPA: STAS domain-containing protein [Candidatus Binataceae bacterium]|nr:STAS domain-containing protein [Candidatus Binataceae bacterium]
MNLAAEKHEGTDVVRMPRRMDAAAADALRSELRDLAGGGSGRLLLDMSAVKFIDSTGLGVIVTAMKAARDRGGRLAMFALPDKVRMLVELTRLHLVFHIYADEAAAMAAQSP